ncbi:hypothetical protein ACRAWB_14515 [Leifsonia poae]|uniref:hypothetical protein n=1 Tax=Leifsonia poae TaxID=110933 RepID=UPI003D6824AB
MTRRSASGMRWLAAGGAVAVVAATLLAGPAATAATTAPVGWQPQRMSVMVQVSSVASQTGGSARLAAVLEDIRLHHRDPSRPGFIQNLVLQDIAPASGNGSPLFTGVLDAVAPYLPGGPRAAFDHVFVGTLLEPPAPAGAPSYWSPYVEGIASPALRSAHLAASTRAAAAFVARYPSVRVDWYLSWEAFLAPLMYADSFAYPAPPRIVPSVLRADYLDYQKRLVAALSGIRPGRAFLWSPALDRSWAQVSVDGQGTVVPANLRSYLSAVQSATGGRLWLDLQDGLSRPCLEVGGAAGNTIADRVDWYHRLATMGLPLAALQVNAETFVSPYCPGVSQPAQVLGRLYAYEQGSIPIGPSFDIFGWSAIATPQTAPRAAVQWRTGLSR